MMKRDDCLRALARHVTDADAGKIKPAVDEAYKASRPVVMLIGRRPA